MISRDHLQQLIDQGYTQKDIALQLGCRERTVARWVSRHSLQRITVSQHDVPMLLARGIQKVSGICSRHGEAIFILRTGSQTRYRCQDCMNEYGRTAGVKHWPKNKLKRQAKRKSLIDLRGGKCVSCSYDRYQGALQFHHLDHRQKKFLLNISSMSLHTQEDLEQEAQKCIVLCVNCHIAFENGLLALEGEAQCMSREQAAIRTRQGRNTPPQLIGALFPCSKHGLVEHIARGTKQRCKPCRSEAVSKLRIRRKQQLVVLKGGACIGCGFDKYICALQFHHRDPSAKRFMLSGSGMTKAWKTVLEEADKCDLLCGNCHAEMHEIPSRIIASL